jgi:hypothetical protein
VALALVEVALAWTALQVSELAASCPELGSGIGCGAVFRPRVARLLGPLTVTHVAFVGAMATFGYAMLLNQRDLPRPLARAGLVALAAGAGFALGLQPLPWLATGAVCPVCVLLTLCACGAVALAVGPARAHGVRPRPALMALGLVVVVAVPLAVHRGRTIAAEDEAGIARVRAAGGDEGPRLVLVTQDGCPYCRGLLADVLADERVLRVIQRTRGVTEVRRSDPGAPKVEGTPTLIVVGPDGQERGRLPGYSRDPGAYATRLMTIVAGPGAGGR